MVGGVARERRGEGPDSLSFFRLAVAPLVAVFAHASVLSPLHLKTYLYLLRLI